MTELKPSDLFKAERELRDFGKSFKAFIALADQLEEVGDLYKVGEAIKAEIQALRVQEAEQRERTQGITEENQRALEKQADSKRRLSAMIDEARQVETARDEALSATEQARAELARITAEHAEIDALRIAATAAHEEAVRAGTEANALHRDLTMKIATLKAQIAGLA